MSGAISLDYVAKQSGDIDGDHVDNWITKLGDTGFDLGGYSAPDSENEQDPFGLQFIADFLKQDDRTYAEAAQILSVFNLNDDDNVINRSDTDQSYSALSLIEAVNKEIDDIDPEYRRDNHSPAGGNDGDFSAGTGEEGNGDVENDDAEA